jgi:hypothetical protein
MRDQLAVDHGVKSEARGLGGQLHLLRAELQPCLHIRARGGQHGTPGELAGGMLIGLVPWVLFTIIADHGTLKIAAVAALVIAIGVCERVPQRYWNSPRPPPASSSATRSHGCASGPRWRGGADDTVESMTSTPVTNSIEFMLCR